MSKMHPTSVRLDDELRAALQRLAKADSRSLSGYIELVLRKHVEKAGAKTQPKR